LLGYGSSGWQAPEQLLHGRQSRAVDLFSLGCILFFCITKGKHPFGDYFERDRNIIKNELDLFLVDFIPESVHLLSVLLDPIPAMRYCLCYHYYFYDYFLEDQKISLEK
jgi:serine/threonine-protein kinase/endoribonuclease IRE1